MSTCFGNNPNSRGIKSKPDSCCPNPTTGAVYNPCYPCPQCITYDPNSPPPGWPNQYFPWDQRGNLPAAVRCNLTLPLKNLNARQAFEAYQLQQIDGGSGVIFLDVRTPEEVYWVGVPTQVNKLTFKDGSSVVPDLYFATLSTCPSNGTPYIEYKVNGVANKVLASTVAATDLTNMTYNVPLEFVDPSTGVSQFNPLWGKQIDALIRDLNPTRIIFFCRSGDRAAIGTYYQFVPFEQLFPGILSGKIIAYSVDVPKPTVGYGGFEGSTYGNTILGYRGFPGRATSGEPFESVSFKDMGLPIKTSTTPKTVCVQPLTGATLKIDRLDAQPWAATHL